MTREIAGLTGRGDSENETAEITPDTDTGSDIEHMHRSAQGGSFKRPAPVMGNRSLETRNSKRAQYHPQNAQTKKEHVASTNFSSNNNATNSNTNPSVTVGALEVQNVKRAINRYGTLPKNARIGAYLESLRQTTTSDGCNNGANASAPRIPVTQTNSSTNGPLIELPPPPPQLANNNNTNSSNAMSPRAVIKAQPQMIRSNSSGGVTMTNSASSSLNKLQRHRTTADGSMITFSSFRGTSGSPKRSFNPALADLEFPPPPLDLPPPPEEFESNADIETSSSRSNLDAFQLSQTTSLAPSNDDTEPSVLSRFGVSLRKREPSTDSCSSLGSPAAGAANETITSGTHAANIKSKDKLVAEIKERSEQYQRKQIADVPNNNNINNNNNNNSINNSNNNNNNGNNSKTSNKSVDHVSQLVNELAETMNLPKLSPAEVAKKNNTAMSATKSSVESNGLANAKNFKAQLKKVDPKKILHTAAKEESNSIVDFKSRLRKVENNNDNETTESTLESKKIIDNDNENDSDRSSGQKKSVIKRNGDTKSIVTNDHELLNNRKKSLTDSKVIDIKKTEVKVEVADDKARRDSDSKANATTCDDEDKRKSTGSISSLKKLWEAKEGSGNSTANNDTTVMQLSPKLTSKNVVGGSGGGSKSADEEFDTLSANKKPAVPTKPTKLVSIYATPIQVKLNSDSTSTTAPTSSSNAASTTVTPNICNNSSTMTATSQTTTTQISREAILDLIQLVEGTLKIPINSISASQWLQLSDKLNILQSSCVNFAEKASMAPHSKFQFRELVTRVENQSRSLRSAGSKNVQDNEKLVCEVGQSLKQISNALHR